MESEIVALLGCGTLAGALSMDPKEEIELSSALGSTEQASFALAQGVNAPTHCCK
jgi:hypothetical protein